MNIGIPKEIRPSEYRVGLNPSGVRQLTDNGHVMLVEHDAGRGAGFSDVDYEKAGASIVYSVHEVYGRADLVLKFARPIEQEISYMREGTTLAGIVLLHSAKQRKYDLLNEKKITVIAYERIKKPDGSRPIMFPLSKIGGRMSAQIAARLLENNQGGNGVLLGGMPGVPPAEVVVLGAGTAGFCAAKAFLGTGAQVTMIDKDPMALEVFLSDFPYVVTMLSTEINLEKVCKYADVLVCAASTPGKIAPKIITRDHVRMMKPRSLIMDISIDQGGNVETSRPTTHDTPTFIEENVIHYCVPNMPGVVARTSTHAFVNAAMPYIMQIADEGIDQAIKNNEEIACAINTHKGEIVNV